MRYTKVAADAFQSLQLNAGILLTSFEPSTGAVVDANIFAATSGGASFNAGPQYVDFGDDIDNVPANTKQLKRIDYYEPRISGTGKTVKGDTLKMLMGACDSTSNGGVTKFTPRGDLDDGDFKDLWWVGDYSDKNGATKGGFIAIRLMNALNTGGFQLQSNDNGKGDLAFDFLGHYDIEDMDTVPYEVYMKVGAAESGN